MDETQLRDGTMRGTSNRGVAHAFLAQGPTVSFASGSSFYKASSDKCLDVVNLVIVIGAETEGTLAVQETTGTVVALVEEATTETATERGTVTGGVALAVPVEKIEVVVEEVRYVYLSILFTN
jgi:hypothetical protein